MLKITSVSGRIMRRSSSEDITSLLVEWSEGKREALDRLFPAVYDELHRAAKRYFQRESSDHTLQPTALVHEVYLRLIDQKRASWKNRAQFFGVAAQLMRRILVDHARARRALKRGENQKLPLLDELITVQTDPPVDVLDLDRALSRLEELDPEKSRMVELRFFGGLTVEEIAEVMGMSARTVMRHWQFARAWLWGAIVGPRNDTTDGN